MFGLDDFQRLEHRLDHDKTFSQVEYLKWRTSAQTAKMRASWA